MFYYYEYKNDLLFTKKNDLMFSLNQFLNTWESVHGGGSQRSWRKRYWVYDIILNLVKEVIIR